MFAPDGGLAGMFDDGRFGRFTTGGFGTVTVILGGGGTRSAAPTAPAIDTKVKQKPLTLDHLNMPLATPHSYPRAAARIAALSSGLAALATVLFTAPQGHAKAFAANRHRQGSPAVAKVDPAGGPHDLRTVVQTAMSDLALNRRR